MRLTVGKIFRIVDIVVMFKNKKVLIGIGVVVGLGILLGGYFLIFNKSKSETPDDEFIEEQIAEELAPEKIGLTMEANASKQAVRFAIAKATGIKSLDYEIIYEADSTAAERSEGGDDRVSRGITGDVAMKSGQSTYQSQWHDLGSCSKNICRYDKGVDSVKITLKVVMDDGKVYQVEKTLEL